jgi:hypothetical protein
VGVGAKTFEELRAWQLAAALSDQIVAVCAMPVLQGDLTFRDQLREAAEAAPRVIAEGFGRWSRREFARYLVMARAERVTARCTTPEAPHVARRPRHRTLHHARGTTHHAPGTARSTKHHAPGTGMITP